MHTDMKKLHIKQNNKIKDWLLQHNDIILKSKVIKHSNKHINLSKPKAEHYKDTSPTAQPTMRSTLLLITLDNTSISRVYYHFQGRVA